MPRCRFCRGAALLEWIAWTDAGTLRWSLCVLCLPVAARWLLVCTPASRA